MNKEELILVAKFLDVEYEGVRKSTLLLRVFSAAKEYVAAFGKGKVEVGTDRDCDQLSHVGSESGSRVDRLSELQLTLKIKQLELETVKIQAVEREKERQHEIEILRIQAGCNNTNMSSLSGTTFN